MNLYLVILIPFVLFFLIVLVADIKYKLRYKKVLAEVQEDVKPPPTINSQFEIDLANRIVLTPNHLRDWLYEEHEGIDRFVFGDYKIYSQGDIWIGTLNTGIVNQPLFNHLVQKFSIAAIKNNCIVDPKLCVTIPTPKSKKKS